METKGIYIYGIVPNFYDAEQFRSLDSLGVYAISFQNIAAIVSDRENAQMDYSDKESLVYLLLHHQKTIEDIMGKGFSMLLPMRLGTIVSSKDIVLKILENGYDLIVNTLQKIDPLTEINLAVTWNNFAEVIKEISRHPEIKAMKDDMLKKAELLTQIDQLRMGQLVKGKIDEKNKEVESKIMDSLLPFSLDKKTHETMNDQMPANAAFLIYKNQKERFEQVIGQLDEEYNAALNFKLIGPLPCYSFYTLEVKDMSPEVVEQAKKELDLPEETSEKEIKNAYLEKAKLFHPDSNRNNGGEENFNRIKNAYHTLLDYSSAARQSSKEECISLAKKKVVNNLILVKIKD